MPQKETLTKKFIFIFYFLNKEKKNDTRFQKTLAKFEDALCVIVYCN